MAQHGTSLIMCEQFLNEPVSTGREIDWEGRPRSSVSSGTYNLNLISLSICPSTFSLSPLSRCCQPCEGRGEFQGQTAACQGHRFRTSAGTPCDVACSANVQLAFRPLRRGLYTVDVRWRRLPLTGNPFHVNAVAAHASEHAQEDIPVREKSVTDHSNPAAVTAAVFWHKVSAS